MSGYLWRGRPGLEELNAKIMAARPEVQPGRRGRRGGHPNSSTASEGSGQGKQGRKTAPRRNDARSVDAQRG